MIYGFDTDDTETATAALLVYAIYRSRDQSRYKVTPDMWSQIERFTKSAAKRARTLAEFMDGLKPRLACGAISPRWMAVGIRGDISLLATVNRDGRTEYIEVAGGEDRREFLTGVLARVDDRRVIDQLYRETGFIILLVRDRLERERPAEQYISDETTQEAN